LRKNFSFPVAFLKLLGILDFDLPNVPPRLIFLLEKLLLRKIEALLPPQIVMTVQYSENLIILCQESRNSAETKAIKYILSKIINKIKIA